MLKAVDGARYRVEVLVDDGEWGEDQSFYQKGFAILRAKKCIQPTAAGACGVRVIDQKTDQVVWDNMKEVK